MLTITCIIPSTCSKKIIPSIKQCLRSLYVSNQGQFRLITVLITDRLESRAILLKERLNDFFFVNTDLGFAERINVGIEGSIEKYESDYYLILNDDTWLDINFFKETKRVIDKSQPDIIMPLVLDKFGKKIDSFGAEYFTSGYVKNIQNLDIKATVATAACFLIKTKLLKKVKKKFGFYFNPLLYYYLEDTEFSIRARVLRGYFIRSKNLKVYHVGSLTTGTHSEFVLYHTYRNMLWVILLTWPTNVIFKQLIKILIVHVWLMYSTFKLKLFLLYPKMGYETLILLKRILKYRTKTLVRYPPSFDFDSIFSKHFFRMRKQNIAI